MSDARPIVRPWEWIPVLPPETVAEFRPYVVQLIRGDFVDGRFVRNEGGSVHAINLTDLPEDGSLTPTPAAPCVSPVEYHRLVSQRMYFRIRGDGRFHPTFGEVLAQVSLADRHQIVAFEIEPMKRSDNVNDERSLAAGYHVAQVCLYTK